MVFSVCLFSGVLGGLGRFEVPCTVRIAFACEIDVDGPRAAVSASCTLDGAAVGKHTFR
jgi:hypothetical protein